MAKIVAVVNRYKDTPFVGMWDGQTYTVEDELLVEDYVGAHLKKQSIVRDNPYDPSDNQYRLWIKGVDEDPGPLEELPVESLVRDDGDPRWKKTTIIRTSARPAAPVHRETFGALDVGQAAKG